MANDRALKFGLCLSAVFAFDVTSVWGTAKFNVLLRGPRPTPRLKVPELFSNEFRCSSKLNRGRGAVCHDVRYFAYLKTVCLLLLCCTFFVVVVCHVFRSSRYIKRASRVFLSVSDKSGDRQVFTLTSCKTLTEWEHAHPVTAVRTK